MSFTVAQHGVPAAGLQEATLLVEAVVFVRENRAQVEPKPINVGLIHPIPQTVHDHLNDIGV